MRTIKTNDYVLNVSFIVSMRLYYEPENERIVLELNCMDGKTHLKYFDDLESYLERVHQECRVMDDDQDSPTKGLSIYLDLIHNSDVPIEIYNKASEYDSRQRDAYIEMIRNRYR